MAGFLIALMLLAGSPADPQAPTPAPPAAAAAAKLSTRTPLSSLMANAEAREVLRKHMPGLVRLLEGPGASQAPLSFTLEDIRSIPRANLTPEKLKAINEDLGKL